MGYKMPAVSYVADASYFENRNTKMKHAGVIAAALLLVCAGTLHGGAPLLLRDEAVIRRGAGRLARELAAPGDAREPSEDLLGLNGIETL